MITFAEHEGSFGEAQAIVCQMKDRISGTPDFERKCELFGDHYSRWVAARWFLLWDKEKTPPSPGSCHEHLRDLISLIAAEEYSTEKLPNMKEHCGVFSECSYCRDKFISLFFDFKKITPEFTFSPKHCPMGDSKTDYEHQRKVIELMNEIRHYDFQTMQHCRLTAQNAALFVDFAMRNARQWILRTARRCLKDGQANLSGTRGYDHLKKRVYSAALLHDIGKRGVLIDILHKPGGLDDNEKEEMKRHVFLSSLPESMLRTFKDLGESETTSCYEEGYLFHHEHFSDRSKGINGRIRYQIPVFARIISIVDFHCALAESRPYRSSMEIQRIKDIAESEQGRKPKFDPHLFARWRSWAHEL